MNRKNPILIVWISLLSTLLFLSACSSGPSNAETKVKKQAEDKYEKLVKEKNKELELQPIELTSYSEEVGATLKEPIYKEFAVNGKVVVGGNIEKYTELKSNYVWIKVYSTVEGPAGNQQEYYAMLKEGKFKQEISFFNGEGEYQVEVQVPSKDSENYYYSFFHGP